MPHFKSTVIIINPVRVVERPIYHSTKVHPHVYFYLFTFKQGSSSSTSR